MPPRSAKHSTKPKRLLASRYALYLPTVEALQAEPMRDRNVAEEPLAQKTDHSCSLNSTTSNPGSTPIEDLKGMAPKENVDGLYLAWCLTASKKRLMRLVDHAGHGTNRLSTDLLLTEPVLMPPLPEQTCIATVLIACQREIDLLSTQLEALKQQKRGMMQKLLTGEVRVRI